MQINVMFKRLDKNFEYCVEIKCLLHADIHFYFKLLIVNCIQLDFILLLFLKYCCGIKKYSSFNMIFYNYT